MEQFKLWNSPISSFFQEGVAPSPTPWCSSYRKGSLRVTLDYGRQLYLLTNEAETWKKELKIEFSLVFSGGFSRCNKLKAKFKLKKNVQPVLKKKKIPLKQINDKLDRLEKRVFYLKLTITIGLHQQYI